MLTVCFESLRVVAYFWELDVVLLQTNHPMANDSQLHSILVLFFQNPAWRRQIVTHLDGGLSRSSRVDKIAPGDFAEMAVRKSARVHAIASAPGPSLRDLFAGP